MRNIITLLGDTLSNSTLSPFEVYYHGITYSNIDIQRQKVIYTERAKNSKVSNIRDYAITNEEYNYLKDCYNRYLKNIKR